MNKINMLVILCTISAIALIPQPASAVFGTDISYLFGSTGERWIYPNASHVVSMRLNAFHGASETWSLYMRTHSSDINEPDNLTWHISCSNGEDATFSTYDYSSWVSSGYIQIPMTYNTDIGSVRYNSIDLDAKTVTCDYTILSEVHINNSINATFRYKIEMIPYYSTLEFVDCVGFDDNPTIQTTNFIQGTVVFMSDAWAIAWIVFSIGAILFAIIGIPIFVFMIIRYIIYSMTGHKLVERRE